MGSRYLDVHREMRVRLTDNGDLTWDHSNAKPEEVRHYLQVATRKAQEAADLGDEMLRALDKANGWLDLYALGPRTADAIMSYCAASGFTACAAEPHQDGWRVFGYSSRRAAVYTMLVSREALPNLRRSLDSGFDDLSDT